MFSVPGDYLELTNATLVIPAGSVPPFQTCGSVEIVGDLVRETNETFTIEITTANPNDIVDPSSILVTILDDLDRKCMVGMYDCESYACMHALS